MYALYAKKKNGCCREVAVSEGLIVMPKIVKTQNNTYTTVAIQKWTNNGFPNTKKPHSEFNWYK